MFVQWRRARRPSGFWRSRARTRILLLATGTVGGMALGGCAPRAAPSATTLPLVGGAHVLAMSIQGYLMLAGAVIGPQHVQGAINTVHSLDTKFNTSFNAVTDPDNMYTFINLHLVLD